MVSLVETSWVQPIDTGQLAVLLLPLVFLERPELLHHQPLHSGLICHVLCARLCKTQQRKTLFTRHC